MTALAIIGLLCVGLALTVGLVAIVAWWMDDPAKIVPRPRPPHAGYDEAFEEYAERRDEEARR